ncbi:MAG TPA: class I SAM-dependent methyltransferase [Roseiflexaceae bacterium]|nr:class I SAM-dependent methyltransferase [Roseiflexaceae bacterium]
MSKQDDITAQNHQAIWDQNAALWDSTIGDSGNRFHRTIVEPAVLALLALAPGETVLEVACGNGAFARTMAAAGAQVVASDFSPNLLEYARQRTASASVFYTQIDATQEEQLLALGAGRFDAAVCNMALMDMPAIEPLFSALARLLKPGGRFVFSVQHPCFNSNGATKTVELHERDGAMVMQHAVKVARYATPWTDRAIGIAGQAVPHPMFHRPINMLLKAGFGAGFVLDGLEEPAATAPPDEQKWWAWSNYKETPPVLVARLRLPPVR